MPTWSLATVAKTVSTVAKTGVHRRKMGREKPEWNRGICAGQSRYGARFYRRKMRCNYPDRLLRVSLDQKPAGGDDWTAQAYAGAGSPTCACGTTPKQTFRMTPQQPPGAPGADGAEKPL